VPTDAVLETIIQGGSTGQFWILNEDEIQVWKVEQCSFCCHHLEAKE
jgi:hypothetical protein